MSNPVFDAYTLGVKAGRGGTPSAGRESGPRAEGRPGGGAQRRLRLAEAAGKRAHAEKGCVPP